MKFSSNASLILHRRDPARRVRSEVERRRTGARAHRRGSKPPPKRATPATCSSTSPTTTATRADSTKRSCRTSCAATFSSHPKLELLVNIESLEFPVDGLAQAVVSVATVELKDPDLQRLKVEFRRSGRAVARGARGSPGPLNRRCLQTPTKCRTKRDCRHLLRFNPNLLAPTQVCESAGIPFRKVQCPTVPNHR